MDIEEMSKLEARIHDLAKGVKRKGQPGYEQVWPYRKIRNAEAKPVNTEPGISGAPRVPSGKIDRMDAHLSSAERDAHEAMSYHPHVPTHVRQEFERHWGRISEDEHHEISQFEKRRRIRAYNRSVNTMRAYVRGPEHGQRDEARDLRSPLRYRQGRR